MQLEVGGDLVWKVGLRGCALLGLKLAWLANNRVLAGVVEKDVGHSPGRPLGTRSAGSCQWCGFPGPGKAEAMVTEGVGTAGPVGRTPAGQQNSWVSRTGERAGPKLALPNLLCDFGLATPLWASASSSKRVRGKLGWLTCEV